MIICIIQTKVYCHVLHIDFTFFISVKRRRFVVMETGTGTLIVLQRGNDCDPTAG